jgi:hypothetical protein
MSRGDEIGEGLPRRGWQEPAGGYDNEPDESRDRDDGARISKPNRSGGVTAVGIVAIILGSLVLLGAVCIGAMSAMIPALQEILKANQNDPNVAKAAQDLNKIPIWYLVASAVVELIRGLGLVIGGIAVLKRINAGRMLTLGMAVYGVLVAFGSLGVGLAMGIIEPSGIASSAVGLIFTCGFAVFAFVVLLSPKNAAEFRS